MLHHEGIGVAMDGDRRVAGRHMVDRRAEGDIDSNQQHNH